MIFEDITHSDIPDTTKLTPTSKRPTEEKTIANYAKKVNHKEKKPEPGQSLVSHGKTPSFQNPIKLGKEGQIIKRQERLQYQV